MTRIARLRIFGLGVLALTIGTSAGCGSSLTGQRSESKMPAALSDGNVKVSECLTARGVRWAVGPDGTSVSVDRNDTGAVAAMKSCISAVATAAPAGAPVARTALPSPAAVATAQKDETDRVVACLKAKGFAASAHRDDSLRSEDGKGAYVLDAPTDPKGSAATDACIKSTSATR